MRPPRFWEWSLGRLVPAEWREAVLGDASEEFARLAEREGPGPARRWYRGQVLGSLLPAARHGIWRAAVVMTPLGRGGDGMMTTWMTDLRLAFRSLWRRPGFAVTVVTTLALGVGATTALFGVFRAVFLQPLDLPDPERLVFLEEEGSFGCCGPGSGPDYLDWTERNRSFEALGALEPNRFTLTGLDEPERVYGTLATASVFLTTGVDPLMGRAFLPDDETTPGTVILSHALWQRLAGGSPDVLGTTLEVDGSPRTVVGVMPEGFDIPSPWNRNLRHQLYLPMPREQLQANRGNHRYPVLARLAPGVTLEAAEADMKRVVAEVSAENPDSHGDRAGRVFAVHDYLFGGVGRQLGLILAAGGLVLLIACGNVAALLLARAASRETELAVRAALGASRRAVTRLLFSESLILALLGGVAGVFLSLAFVDGLRAVLPPSIPRVEEIAIDGAALAFAAAASLFTALVFGMLPAILASRGNLAASVKEGGYGTFAPVKERARDWFIVGQIALGLVLANGAALLVRSYATLMSEDFGFRDEGVLTLALNPAGPGYGSEAELVAYYDQVRGRVAGIPGVSSLGTISHLPLFGGANGNVLVEGAEFAGPSNRGPLAEMTSISGDYFGTMGVEILQGRALLPEDSVTGSVGAVVNETLAEQAWPGESPLGKRFSFSDPPNWITVVGVARDVRQWGPERPAVGQAYVPYNWGWTSAAFLALRMEGDPTAMVPEVRRAILSVDPTQPPSDIQTMTARVDRTFAQRRFYTTLIALFALAALLLSSAGVYGTVSYFVARRVRELGIRMALGAGSSGIMRLVVRRGVRLSLWGVGIGLLGVWASTSVVEGMVYGMEGTDPLTLVAGCLVMAGVAVVGSALPALRASNVSPVTALRSE